MLSHKQLLRMRRRAIKRYRLVWDQPFRKRYPQLETHTGRVIGRWNANGNIDWVEWWYA